MALHKKYNYFISRNSLIPNKIANHTIIAINNSDNNKK